MKRTRVTISMILILVMLMSLVFAGCSGDDTTTGSKADPNGTTAHEHTYSESWESNDTQHWHAASCEHSAEKKDVADHVDADLNGACDVCGAQVAIPDHDHKDENDDNKCDICDVSLYTVTFTNGDTVISSAKVAPGSKVAIPAAPASVDATRYTFTGWQGVSDAEMAEGEVEVFNSDLSYSAKWSESFGTSLVVEIPEVRQLADIVADGIKDSVYDDVTPIEIRSDKTGATAKAYVLWSSEYFYVFVEVKDSTVNDNDFVELRLELLHTDKYAASDWNGGWGGHRKDAASEGGWKIKSGASSTEKYWEYWSHLTDERNSSFGASVRNEEGYTAEWVIKIENDGFGSVEEDLIPHIGQEIGMGILINDEGNGWAGIENFDGYNSSVKKLTNTKLVANGKNDPNTVVASVNAARANWDVEDQDIRDRMFTGDVRFPDFSSINVGESVLKALWSEGKLYIRPVPGATTKSLVLTIGGKAYAVDLAAPAEIAIEGNYKLKDLFDFSVTYQDGDAAEVNAPCTFKLQANPWNRNKYTISKLDGDITIDGSKDAAYGDAGLDINVSTEGNPSATGKAYLKWSDEYLYVLVEVTDNDVTPPDNQIGDSYNNDSVELWISTCRVLPNNGWGNIRPTGDYCGEGGFRVQTNNVVSGQHWMYDWVDGVPRETAVAITDNGYNVEYKIHFSAFAGVENKVGQCIDLMININDDDGNDSARDGVTSLNTSGNAAWDQPWALDRFELVA